VTAPWDTGDKKVPVTYRYDSSINVVFTRPTGVLTPGDVSSYFAEVAANPEIAPHFVEVVLFDDVEDFAFRYSEAVTMVDEYRQSMLTKQCARTVFIARTSVGYGIARMLSAVVGDHADFRVVRTDDELAQELSDIRSGALRFES
jgi:hypothetical protein